MDQFCSNFFMEQVRGVAECADPRQLARALARALARVLPRALVASALAALLDLVVLVVLVQAFGWHPLFAVTVSYLLGGVLQYILSALWVFPAAPQRIEAVVLKR